MNDSSFAEIEKIVDRTMRLMRASSARKRRIREELLAHVSGVFEEELGLQGDEQLAIAETRRRFGADGELEYEFQASVPLYERILSSFAKENLMSRKLWAASVAAIAVGPAMILPALAHYKEKGVFDFVPLMLGAMIVIAGVALAGYGIKQHFARPA